MRDDRGRRSWNGTNIRSNRAWARRGTRPGCVPSYSPQISFPIARRRSLTARFFLPLGKLLSRHLADITAGMGRNAELQAGNYGLGINLDHALPTVG